MLVRLMLLSNICFFFPAVLLVKLGPSKQDIWGLLEFGFYRPDALPVT